MWRVVSVFVNLKRVEEQQQQRSTVKKRPGCSGEASFLLPAHIYLQIILNGIFIGPFKRMSKIYRRVYSLFRSQTLELCVFRF